MAFPYLSHDIASAMLRAEGYGTVPTDALTAKQKAAGPAFSITISREVGAQGHSVAEELGRRLGWPVYDHEILDKMAEQMGKPREYLHALDERHVSWLEECLTNLVAHYPPVAPLT